MSASKKQPARAGAEGDQPSGTATKHDRRSSRSVSGLNSKVSLLRTRLFRRSKVDRTRLTIHSEDGADLVELPRLGPGYMVNGRYEIVSVIGEGGMGIVYEILDHLKSEQGRAALKMVRGAMKNAELKSLLSAEFANVVQLRHPNIIEVRDFEQAVGSADCLFTMELVDGKDIYRHTSGAGWQSAVNLCVQVCRALSYVHSRNMIHFDLKPSNVLVNLQGQAKVLDFGLSQIKRADRSGDSEDGIRGTMTYMAPEMASAPSRVDHRVDLYSLGIMLYELVCRRLPFRADSTSDWIHKHHFEEIQFDQGSKVPEWLQKIIIKLCAKQPEERFTSANAVIEAINAGGGLKYELETVATRQSYLLAARMVGREEELDRISTFLEAWLARREDDTSHRKTFLLVSGNSGLGKSRLLREVRREVQLAQVPFVEANCYENDLSDFGPVEEALGHVVGLVQAAGGADLITRHAQDLLTACPRIELGLPTDANKSAAGSNSGETKSRQALVHRLSEFIAEASTRVPFVLYVNDLQWAHGGTIELLTALAERLRTQDSPLALLGTARKDEIEGRPVQALVERLKREDNIEAIELAPLTPEGVSCLIGAMLGVDELPSEFIDRVQQATQGNPFFVQETMRMLVEDGAVYLENGRWAASGEIGKLEIPASIADAFMRRFTALSEIEREVVEYLAICDRPIWVPALARATGRKHDQLQACLEILSRREIVSRGEEVDARYRLAHDQMRAAVVASLSPEKAKTIHGRVAKGLESWLKKMQAAVGEGSEVSEHADWLAFHFSKAEKWEPAVQYGVRAAKNAQRIGRVVESLKLHEMSLEWFRKPGSRLASGQEILVDLLLQLNRLYEIQGDRAKQGATLIELLGILDPERNSGQYLEVISRLGEVHVSLREFEEGEAILKEGLAEARGRGDDVNERNMLRSLALLYWQKGEREAFDACYEDIFAINVKHGDKKAFVVDRINRANALGVTFRDYDRALAVIEEGLEVALKMDLKYLAGISYYQMANIFRSKGDLHRSIEVLTNDYLRIAAKGLENSEGGPQWDAGVNGELLRGLKLLSDLHWELGEQEPSIRWVHKAIEISRESGFAVELSDFLGTLGERSLQINNPEVALRAFQEAVRRFSELEDFGGQSEGGRDGDGYLKALLGVAMAQERLPGQEIHAFDAWKDLRALCEKRADVVNEAFALENMARLARVSGLTADEARALYEQALEVRSTMGDKAKVASILNALGTLMWKERRYEVALGYYERARSVFAELGDTGLEGLVRNSIGLTLKCLRRFADAKIALSEAVKFNIKHGNMMLAGHSKTVLADMCLEQAQEEALNLYRGSMELRVQASDRKGEGWMQLSIARVELDRKRHGEAMAALSAARAIATETGDANLSSACDALQSVLKGEEFKKYLDVLLQVSLATAFQLERQETVALDQVIRLLGADRAFLFLEPLERVSVDPVGRRHGLQFVAGRDSSGGDLAETEQYSRSVVKKVMESREPCFLVSSSDGAALDAQSMVIHGLRSVVAAPLLVQERCIGVIYLDSKVARASFAQADVDILTAISGHIAVALETARSARREIERREMLKDLEVAGSVQGLLIPKKSEVDMPGLRFAAKYESAAHSGGDWWWYETRADGSMLFIVGDVTGHGVGSAMVTATIASAYRMISRGFAESDVPRTLRLLNESLFALTAESYLMSMFILVVDAPQGKARAWVCGAPSGFVLRNDGHVEHIGAAGVQLGQSQTDFNVGFIEKDVRPGDQLLLLTDGLYEFKIEGDRQYGKRSLSRFYETLRGKNCIEVREAIWQEINSKRSGPFDDDITYVVVELT